MNEDTKVRVFLVGIILLIIGGLFYGNNEKTAVNKKTADIVLETDIGEKFIVKETAVTIHESNPLWNFKKQLDGSYLRSLRISTIEQIKTEQRKATEQEIFDIKSLAKEANEKKSIYIQKYNPILNKYDDSFIVSYDITYKPIFQDINDFKRVMDTKSVICVNPLLKEIPTIAELYKSRKMDLLDEKVCSKYADFEKDWNDLPDEYR